MKRIVTIVLTFMVLALGAFTVFANPLNPAAITVGMFLVAVAILNLAVQIYFPPTPEQTVELKVVEEPIKAVPAKPRAKAEKPRIRRKKR